MNTKVILNYDPASGSISDKNGTHIHYLSGLQYEPVGGGSEVPDINQLIKLKDAGFTVEELTLMKDRGLL